MNESLQMADLGASKRTFTIKATFTPRTEPWIIDKATVTQYNIGYSEKTVLYLYHDHVHIEKDWEESH